VVECLRFWQVAQLNVKHIWESGTMHQATWYSLNENYNKFPHYAHFGSLTAGAFDATIGEVVGIPLLIRTSYQLMSDEEQQQAFAQLFTKDGFNGLKNSLKDEVVESFQHPEKGVYYTTNASVTIAFALVLGGSNIFLKGSKKLFDVFEILETLARKFNNCPNIIKYINKLKQANLQAPVIQLQELSEKISPEKLEKLMQFVPETEIGEVLEKLHKLKDVTGIEAVVSDMGTYYTKFKGGKFVVDYATEQGDDFIKNITKFEAEDVIRIGDEVKVRKYDIKVGEDYKIELKDWSAWQNWSDKVVAEQFIKDLNGIGDFTELKWIFKKTDGISDIEMLRKNVIKALESNTEMLKLSLRKNNLQLKKLFDTDIKTPDDIIEQLNNPELFEQIFKIY